MSAASAQQVSWSISSEKVAKNEYLLTITAKVPEGYHMYNIGAAATGGPIPTEITPVEAPGVTFVGDVEALTKPDTHFDEAFSMEISSFEGTAKFTQRVKAKKKSTVSVKTRWMICSGMNCKPPISRTLTITL